MFLELNKLKQDHNLNIRGIIHVGAHLLEERTTYSELGINNVVWIEANENLTKVTREMYPEEVILNHAVYDVDDVEMVFNIASNGQSSSLLKFGTHASLYPQISFSDQINIKTKTLSTIIANENINISNFNMLNLDIQGVELRAIKGLGDYISNIDYIYTEVNDDQVYEGNDLISDIDTFLQAKGFVRKETFIINGNWGDALYTR